MQGRDIDKLDCHGANTPAHFLTFYFISPKKSTQGHSQLTEDFNIMIIPASNHPKSLVVGFGYYQRSILYVYDRKIGDKLKRTLFVTVCLSLSLSVYLYLYLSLSQFSTRIVICDAK